MQNPEKASHHRQWCFLDDNKRKYFPEGNFHLLQQIKVKPELIKKNAHDKASTISKPKTAIRKIKITELDS
jgi:hypothetical protein